MPCIYFTHWVLGRLGSGLRRYRYSAICFHIPIKKLYHKDTVNYHRRLIQKQLRRRITAELILLLTYSPHIKTFGRRLCRTI